MESRVNDFVAWLFRDFRPTISRGPKVINDSLLGNQFFARHEVALIDSSLLQRLKRIKQTGLVFQVFPSARHSRFEHSLGVATVAERCFAAIADRSTLEDLPAPEKAARDRGDLAELRMAALLHDVGHGLCSHLSEQIYEAHTELDEFRNKPEYVRNSPGEILSYLIVKSPIFREWFGWVSNECNAEINVDNVCEMILGRHPDKKKYYLSQIVSSPYDADKLDYIARDSYYCGLALTVDLPRFYSMISTTELEGYRMLVLRSYVPLEQILFSKMTLYGSVYHHHKVKCLDHMLRSLLTHIATNFQSCSFTCRGTTITFKEPVEFLYATDDEFFNDSTVKGDDFVANSLARLRRRDLLSRALEISRRTVTNWDDHVRKGLIDLSVKHAQLSGLENHIYDVLPGSTKALCARGEVLLSVPPPPKLKGGHAFIQTDHKAKPETIEGFFPLEQWNDSYSHSKWKSFVFAPREHRAAVRTAAIAILKEDLGLEVDQTVSDQACHIS